MATPTLISVENVTLPSSADSGNISVTAPTGANACVIGGTGYLSDNNVPTSLTGTQLSAVSLLARDGAGGSFMTVWAAHAKVTATGSQTIRLQKTGNWTEGPTCQIIWLTVDDPDDFVRAWTNTGTNSNLAAPDDFAALSVTIASASTDLVVGMFGKDSNDSLSAPSGTSQQGTTQGPINKDYSLAFKVTTPGASTTTVTTTSISYPSLFAIALKEGSGAQNLSPPLVTRTRTIYAPTVTTGAVSLSPPLVTRTRTVYAPTVTTSNTISPPLVTRTRVIYAPTVTPGSVSLSPPLVARTRAVYAPTVTQPGGADQNLSPPLTTRSRSIYAPTVTPGAVTITPPLVSRTRVVYLPGVTVGAVTLSPPLVTRVRVIHAPTVSQPSLQSLFPPLVVRSRAIYPPTVSDDTQQAGAPHGFVITDTAPKLWWQRKPKALDEQEAAERVAKVVRVVERIARKQVEADRPAPAKEQKREVREAIAPLVAEMPGFDWMTLYRTILIEMGRRQQEQQAAEQAQMEIARIQAMRRDEDDVLLLLMSI